MVHAYPSENVCSLVASALYVCGTGMNDQHARHAVQFSQEIFPTMKEGFPLPVLGSSRLGCTVRACAEHDFGRCDHGDKH